MIHIYAPQYPKPHTTDLEHLVAVQQCHPEASTLVCEQRLEAHPQNILQLVQGLQIPINFFNDALDPDTRPRIEHSAHATLILIHVPEERMDILALHDDVKYRTIPFAMIITPQYLITVCKQQRIFQAEFFSQLKFNHYSALTTQAVLHVIQNTAVQFTWLIQNIEAANIAAENELSRSYRNQELYVLLYLNESLLFSTTSLKQMIQLIRSSHFQATLAMNSSEHEYLQHSLIELEQVFNTAKINQQNLNNVMDAYGNVIQNNVSHVVKLLTAVTIVLSIPTLISSVYGMNVPLPFQHYEHAFSLIIAMMLVSSALVSFYFYKKQYF